MQTSLLPAGSVAGGTADVGRGKLELMAGPSAAPALRLACRHVDEEAGEQELLAHIARVCESAGYTFPPALIVNYYVSLKTNPFVVLAGPRGTNKADFTRLFAQALVGPDSAQYALIPGGAAWHSATGEGSYYRSLQDRFTSLRFLEILQEATAPANLGKIYLVCLERLHPDEITHFFSTLLRVEPGSPKRLNLLGVPPERQPEIPPTVYITATVDTPGDAPSLSPVVLRNAGLIEFRAPTAVRQHLATPIPPAPVGFQRLWARAAVQGIAAARSRLTSILGADQLAQLRCSPDLGRLLWRGGIVLHGPTLRDLTVYVANSFDERGRGLYDPLDARRNAQIAFDAQVVQRVIWRLRASNDAELCRDLAAYLDHLAPVSWERAVA